MSIKTAPTSVARDSKHVEGHQVEQVGTVALRGLIEVNGRH